MSAAFNFIWIVLGGIGLIGTNCQEVIPRLYTCFAITMAADTLTCVIAIIGIIISCVH